VITPTSNSTIAARLGLVDEHVRLENAHDLNGIMRTFGESARYDDEPWGAHYLGRKDVRTFYAQCGIFTFDKDNQLAGEKIYYDRATVLAQLGVFHEPQSLRGRITTVLAHPVTIARIGAWKIFRLRSKT
jgi:hypothetical protein